MCINPFLVGCGFKAEELLREAKDAFKNALKWIGERYTERLNGVRKTLLVNSKGVIRRRSGNTSQPTTATHAFTPWGGALWGRDAVSIHWPWWNRS